MKSDTGIVPTLILLQHNVVREALYACGAADALMNPGLSPSVRRKYEIAWGYHDNNAHEMILEATNAFDQAKARGDYPDVLPLCFASFLMHAAGVSIVLLFPSVAVNLIICWSRPVLEETVTSPQLRSRLNLTIDMPVLHCSL